MNERIKELAEQARKYARDYVADCKHHGHYMEHNELEEKFEEKFAELIVRECLAKAEEEEELYRGFSHLGGAEYAKVMYNYQLLLKEHFGVE